MKVTGYNFWLFPSQNTNHKNVWGKEKKILKKKRKILQEKQTRAILRWFQSCLIAHEDLQNE